MLELDVTMTAVRRPELVELTLRSFTQNFLGQISPGTLFLNVDPLWGDEQSDVAVEQVCRRFFERVRVRRPENASYGAAVKWLWSSVETDWFLHLEDDWVLTWRLSPQSARRQMDDPSVGQLKLANWRRIRRQKVAPKIGVSPSFIRREFANIASHHMDPELDPEKQFYKGFNPAGSKALENYEVRYYGTALSPRLMLDTGRAWRDQRAIEKAVIDGRSTWSEHTPMNEQPFVMTGFERRLSFSKFLPSI